VVPVLVMMVVGIPLYVCATGSVPLAAGFIHAGVSPGAALAFLIAGPATNAATVTTLVRILGRRTTAIYLATVAVSALGGGLILDALAAGLDLRLPALHVGHHHHGIGWLEHLWAGLLVAVMVVAFRPTRSAAGAAALGRDAATVTLAVEGMNCSHCTASVEQALREQPGVTSVSVSLAEERAVVAGNGLDAVALAAAVSDLGYPATPA
jgi:copper chaperone CopZ